MKVTRGKVRIAIDASRNRAGGAKAHLIGLIGAAEPERFGFSEVHVWSYDSLLRTLPDRPWLVRHSPPELEGSILHQLRWQRWGLPAELKATDCAIVLNTDAGTVCRFRPSVTMSRDLLPYTPDDVARYGFGKARLRLFVLRYLHSRSLRLADGAIFLTHHAGEVIQRYCGRLSNVSYVPHGVGENFRAGAPRLSWPKAGMRDIHCVYVSNTAPYKHQWVVVRAIEALRRRGHAVRLTLIGGGHGHAQARLEGQIAKSDPSRMFVRQLDFVAHDELPALVAEADVFIFASSCENMPNTLLEGMAAGCPIACSDRGPMPEILGEWGVYFDPEDHHSIATALERIFGDHGLREQIATGAWRRSSEFSWKRCASETFAFLESVVFLKAREGGSR